MTIRWHTNTGLVLPFSDVVLRQMSSWLTAHPWHDLTPEAVPDLAGRYALGVQVARAVLERRDVP